MTPRPPLRRVQHVAIKVSDIDRSIQFYQDVLGLKLTERHEPGELPHIPVGLAFMRCEQYHHDLTLVFFPKDTDLSPTRMEDSGKVPAVGLHHFAFQVDCEEAFHQFVKYLEEKGIPFVRGPVLHSPTDPRGDGTWGENWAVYFTDPDGHRIEVFCCMAKIPD